MLIFDANLKNAPTNGAELLHYLDKGVEDAAPGGDFKDEDHPRGGKGSKEGGRFVKSEKTKQKEDDVDDLEGDLSDKQKKDLSDLKFSHQANMKHAMEAEHREIEGHRMYNGEEGVDAIKQRFERVYGLLEKAYKEDREELMKNPNCDQEKFRTYSSEYYNSLVHGVR